MNNEANAEPVDFEVKSKTLEEENEKLKLALTEVNKRKMSILEIQAHFVSIF